MTKHTPNHRILAAAALAVCLVLGPDALNGSAIAQNTTTVSPSQTTSGGTSDEESKTKVRPYGVELETGVVFPESADATALFGAKLHLGNVFQKWLYLSAGMSYWNADLDRSELADDVSGSISDTRFYGALQMDLFRVSGVRPYTKLGLALHRVKADVDNDASLEDALEGTSLAPELGFGVTGVAGQFEVNAEIRREFADDTKNWSLELGLGTHWGGPRKDDGATTIITTTTRR